ncbi:hypothetical protein [Trichothermofontia sp.]
MGRLSCLLKLSLITLLGVGGIVWLLNLPYPTIRRPVARAAPWVLTPSFIRMDYDYRQAIANLEQAEQLINQATSPQDLALGEQKLQAAQTHLDALPAWFLDSAPRRDCSLVQCRWQFTLDEFKAARTRAGQLQAKVFQETNAQAVLTQGDQQVRQAKQAYQQASTPEARQQAIAQWQAGIDQLTEIPPTTLAARMAQPKLIAYKRDVTALSGGAPATTITRSNPRIAAAGEFARLAAQSSQQPPYTTQEWQAIVELWQQAIARLKEVPANDAGYLDAQTKLAEYQRNLGMIQTWQQAEKESVQALQRAKDLTAQWVAAAERASAAQQQGSLQAIINQLEQVKPGTTAYEEATLLLASAHNRLKQLQQQS